MGSIKTQPTTAAPTILPGDVTISGALLIYGPAYNQLFGNAGSRHVVSGELGGSAGGAPGGAPGDVQFQATSTTFGGEGALHYDSAANVLTASGLVRSYAALDVTDRANYGVRIHTPAYDAGGDGYMLFLQGSGVYFGYQRFASLYARDILDVEVPLVASAGVQASGAATVYGPTQLYAQPGATVLGVRHGLYVNDGTLPIDASLAWQLVGSGSMFGGDLTVSSPAHFDDAVDFDGPVTFDVPVKTTATAPLQVSGLLRVYRDTHFGTSASLAGTRITSAGDVQVSGVLRTYQPVLATGPVAISGGSLSLYAGGEQFAIEPNVPANFVSLRTATAHLRLDSGGDIALVMPNASDSIDIYTGATGPLAQIFADGVAAFPAVYGFASVTGANRYLTSGEMTTGTGTPAAPVQAIQYNDAGSFGGDADFRYDAANKRVVLSGHLAVTSHGTLAAHLYSPPSAAGLTVDFLGSGSVQGSWTFITGFPGDRLYIDEPTIIGAAGSLQVSGVTRVYGLTEFGLGTNPALVRIPSLGGMQISGGMRVYSAIRIGNTAAGEAIFFAPQGNAVFLQPIQISGASLVYNGIYAGQVTGAQRYLPSGEVDAMIAAAGGGPAGPERSVQVRSGAGFAGDDDFRFTTSNKLVVSGEVFVKNILLVGSDENQNIEPFQYLGGNQESAVRHWRLGGSGLVNGAVHFQELQPHDVVDFSIPVWIRSGHGLQLSGGVRLYARDVNLLQLINPTTSLGTTIRGTPDTAGQSWYLTGSGNLGGAVGGTVTVAGPLLIDADNSGWLKSTGSVQLSGAVRNYDEMIFGTTAAKGGTRFSPTGHLQVSGSIGVDSLLAYGALGLRSGAGWMRIIPSTTQSTISNDPGGGTAAMLLQAGGDMAFEVGSSAEEFDFQNPGDGVVAQVLGTGRSVWRDAWINNSDAIGGNRLLASGEIGKPFVDVQISGALRVYATAPVLISQSTPVSGMLKLINTNSAAGDRWWMGFNAGADQTDGNDRARFGCEIQAGGPGHLWWATGNFHTLQPPMKEWLRLTDRGHLLIGHTTQPTTGSGIISLTEQMKPAGAGTTQAGIFAADTAGTTELFAFDGAGNQPQLTPHNFDLFEAPYGAAYPWSYYARNEYLGLEIGVDMYRAMRALERLSGETLIHLRRIPRTPWIGPAPMPAWMQRVLASGVPR